MRAKGSKEGRAGNRQNKKKWDWIVAPKCGEGESVKGGT